jgi:hypothetical protein
MKKQYDLRDQVWIHLGERNLVQGRVVEIIDLLHLSEGYPDEPLYVIEIKTGIEDVYEVRNYDQISPDDRGPIMLYRKQPDLMRDANRALRRIGMVPPDLTGGVSPLMESLMDDEDQDPTPDQIHAALAVAEKGHTTIFKPIEKADNRKPRNRRTFSKRKKNDASANAG